VSGGGAVFAAGGLWAFGVECRARRSRGNGPRCTGRLASENKRIWSVLPWVKNQPCICPARGHSGAKGRDSMEQVTIIGAGVVGICTALSLAEKGVLVRLIDRDAPGQGASYGNAGVVAPHSIVPNAAPGLWKKLPGWLLSKSFLASQQWPLLIIQTYQRLDQDHLLPSPRQPRAMVPQHYR
jgi:hypothetical protein